MGREIAGDEEAHCKVGGGSKGLRKGGTSRSALSGLQSLFADSWVMDGISFNDPVFSVLGGDICMTAVASSSPSFPASSNSAT